MDNINGNKIASIPEWLKGLVAEPEKQPGTTTVQTTADDEAISEGRRNDHLASLAGSMRRRDMSEDGIKAALLIENMSRCKPPLDDAEVEKIAASIAKYEPEEAEELLPKKVAAALVQIGMKTQLFHDDKGDAYTAIEEGGITRIYCLRRSRFKEWLSREYYRKTGDAPGHDSINAAVGTLTAMANCDCECHNLSLRFAESEKSFWLDLCDARWRAVKVESGKGWQVVNKPPILFTRHSHMLALPDPEIDGSIDDILKFINVKSAGDKLLLKAYSVAAMVPCIPKPILIFHGTQGSGKSYACRIIRDLLDPSEAALLTLHTDEAQFAQNLHHHAVPVFDNQGVWKRKVSDMLCKAATGSSFQKRKLYTDDDDIIMSFKRPVILNGITVPSDAPDFMDRSILIELERISQDSRRTESALIREFAAVRPKILGSMLGVLSKAMELEPELGDDPLYRMADFCRWGKAVAIAMGHTEDEFDLAMKANADERNSEILSNDPLANALEKLLKEKKEWTCTASELLKELERFHENETRFDGWPQNNAYLSKRLRELQPLLIGIKIRVTFSPGHHKGRLIMLSLEP